MIKSVHKIYFIVITLLFLFVKTNAQQTIARDSVVQLYGVVMTADSLRAIGGASVIVVDKGRGTITNNDGVFSIAVLKGDKITFSCIGFKDKTIYIPHHLQDNQYSVI